MTKNKKDLDGNLRFLKVLNNKIDAFDRGLNVLQQKIFLIIAVNQNFLAEKVKPSVKVQTFLNAFFS